ncbi:DegT/DnrJ/EryC1/StrS family aminotransferase [Clostridium estertheticum]|nr:DegT/DnrJ/EryC1/StrS family aminotransferase [Clostridium estertheticum]
MEYVISAGSGADVLIVALKSLCIGHSDEVITIQFTFFSSNCMSDVADTPVFVDVEKDSYNIIL